MAKINLDEFQPVVEKVELKRNVTKDDSVTKFIDKCVEIFDGMEIGQSFVVEKKFLGHITLKEKLKERIADTKEYRLRFSSIKAGEDVTGTRIIKAQQKSPEETNTNTTAPIQTGQGE